MSVIKKESYSLLIFVICFFNLKTQIKAFKKRLCFMIEYTLCFSSARCRLMRKSMVNYSKLFTE